jgi:hypothetical protein
MKYKIAFAALTAASLIALAKLPAERGPDGRTIVKVGPCAQHGGTIVCTSWDNSGHAGTTVVTP